jgi:1,4-dihydroxy-2-naphthoate octaprenyltransferase
MTWAQTKLLLQELRAPFFTASAVPVLLGAALAYWHTTHLDWPLFLLTLAGVVLFHAGANTANDYYDHLSGNDAANTRFIRPFSGGSRLIQTGLLAPGMVLALSLSCFAAGGLIGLYLAWRAGGLVLVLGAIGGLAGFFYTAPPLKLGYRGWGELVVAITFGVMPVAGAYYVQTSTLPPRVLAASLPIALLVTAILFINQFPDYEADRAVAKRNWVVRLGPTRARPIYAVLMMLWPLLIAAGVGWRVLPWTTLFALVGILPALAAIRIVWRYAEDPVRMVRANALTILIHLGVGLALAVGVALGPCPSPQSSPPRGEEEEGVSSIQSSPAGKREPLGILPFRLPRPLGERVGVRGFFT